MRRSGRTTRIVDEAIQQLFTKGSIYVPTKTHLEENLKDTRSVKKNMNYIVDPDWDKGYAQRDLFSRILKRLELEHNFKANDSILQVDLGRMTFTLTDFKK
ncbi:hypothetical protein H4K35_09010 [Myroides sp. NP-2]|uniref:hypothetical protein n=1 Tax=Myroides sp. NP-2 TaxID=2759945 RepID=UPI0015F8E687|nr:hypothetical protein [Myroides sp. NP-2]MBB1150266.1 hypothetical protein [Myroides sp. NP-2]